MEHHWIERPDARLHAVTWDGGHDPGTPPVLLLHGLGGNTVTWEPVGGRLADELATRVVAIDLPGFGRSRRHGRRATVAANARLVHELVGHLDLGPAIVVGNSMGGCIGVHAAARFPGAVAALVTVNTPWPRHDWRSWPRTGPDDVRSLVRFCAVAVPGLGERVFELHQRSLGPSGSVDVPVAFLFRDPARLDPGVRARLVEVSEHRFGWGPEAAAAYVEATRSLWWYLFDPGGMGADGGRVDAPTMVVHGTADRLVPRHLVDSVRHRRPTWAFALLDDVGHVPQLEDPDRFVATVVAWARAAVGASGEVEPAR